MTPDSLISWFRPRRLAAAVVVVALSACGDAGDAPRPSRPEAGYWRLSVNYHAVTLSTVAPNNVIQLRAVPLSLNGDTMPLPSAPTFLVSDHSVTVDSTGLLTARAPVTGSVVIVRATVGNLTLSDTVIVNVTTLASPPTLGAISIQPTGPSDTVLAVLGTRTLRPVVTTPTGGTISGLALYFTSSDTTIATINRTRGLITGQRAGHVTIRVAATAYGVTRTDSFDLRIGNPIFVAFSVLPVSGNAGPWYVTPGTLHLAPGGSALFFNGAGTPLDIVFDDSVDVQPSPYDATGLGGNIPAFAPNDPQLLFGAPFPYRARTLATPGTHHFHSVLTGVSATIIVEP